MGLFGSKNKDAGKQAAPKTDTQASRKSVRRVVPAGGKAGGPPPLPARAQPSNRLPAAAPAAPAARPVAAPAPALVDDLDVQLPAAPTAPAERPASKAPITASSAPTFTGSLAGSRSGPSRTGDQVLIDFLTGKAALLTSEQAGDVRNKSRDDEIAIDEAAVKLGFITEEQLVNALSQETWVPHLKVDKYEIRKKALDTITRDDAQYYGVFPVDKLGSLLTLAMINPLDAEAIRLLETRTGLDIKKVVATRSEINQAIDKYYGGKVAASEGSRSFSQEVPEQPKSATQMLSRGVEAAATPAASPVAAPTPAKPATALPAHDIAADIQDIDDLLGGEEVIAPAIIEPVSIKPEEIPAAELPAVQPVAAEPEFSLPDAPKEDLGALEVEPLPAAAATPATAAPLLAPEFELDQPEPARSAPSSDGPRIKPPAPAPVPPAPAKAPSAHPPVAKTAERELRTATARIAAGNAGSRVVDLLPVLEDEFRYAISHGKGKVFDRWIALQSRNRIINAVAVEKELDGVLSGLYASPRKAG